MFLNTCNAWVSSEYGLKIECLPCDLLPAQAREGFKNVMTKRFTQGQQQPKAHANGAFCTHAFSNMHYFSGQVIHVLCACTRANISLIVTGCSETPLVMSSPLHCFTHNCWALLNSIDEQDTADNLLIPTIFKIHCWWFSM